MMAKGDFENERLELSQSFIDNLPDIVYRYRFAPPRMEYVNSAAARLLGYTPDDFCRDPELVFKLVHPDDRPQFQRIMKQSEPVQPPPVFRWQRKDGEYVWMEQYNTLIQDEAGQTVAVQGVARNITPRKQAEQALRESEERFRLFVNAVSDSIYKMSADWSLMLNLKGLEFLADTAQPSGDWREQYIPRDEQPRVQAAIAEAIRNKRTFALEHRVIRADGTVGWTYSHAIPVLDEHGEIVEWFGAASDVTTRKQAEQELRRSEQVLEAFFASSPGILNIEDDEFRYVKTDSLTPTYFGLTRERIVGKAVKDLAPEFMEQFGPMMQRVIETGKPELNVEVYSPVPGRLGEVATWQASYFPVPLAGGKTGIGIMGVDITRLKQAEKERQALLEREQAARAQAEAAVRVRDQFISVASHELKTPLTTIKGYAELVVQRGQQLHLDESLQRMLNTINAQSGRLEKMIDVLLDVSRIERGQLSLERGPVDLEALLQYIVDHVRPTLRKHTLEFKCTGQRVMVEGDETRLEQVLQNLIQNAAKYSPMGGPIFVELSRVNGAAEIAVTDNGIGIPEADLPKLFTRFHRAQNAEAFHINGLGVGLFVVREIARLHGGEITVESQEGIGSTFRVLLPVQ